MPGVVTWELQKPIKRDKYFETHEKSVPHNKVHKTHDKVKKDTNRKQ
jgi:hypothetical protein